MSNYINYVNLVKLPQKNKAQFLLDNVPGARKVTEPVLWYADLVCVHEGGYYDFEGARYVESPRVLEAIKLNGVDKTWLYVPNAKKHATNTNELKAPAPPRQQKRTHKTKGGHPTIKEIENELSSDDFKGFLKCAEDAEKLTNEALGILNVK